ncbi:MAG TPA: cardiolipin synthase [Burkholderiaceae bacterium]|nr:cardiolipin synthase [Burkholderiaceae bacterium]
MPAIPLAELLHLLVAAVVILRILSRRNPPGIAQAWILLVVLLPAVGVVLYFMIGERRLGRRWIERAERGRPALRRRFAEVIGAAGIERGIHADQSGAAAESVSKLVQSLTGLPPMRGHRVQLIDDGERFLHALIEDIESARQSCQLEFYIWSAGGLADGVVDALVRAVQRGVQVQVLMDGLGSRPFTRTPQYRRLRDAGIDVEVVLPVGALRLIVARADLRDHRKIAVIDDRIAYTGSCNLADPMLFKRDAGLGQWVDAMIRIEGPVAALLAEISSAMAELQHGRPRERSAQVVPAETASAGTVALQIFPSGPGFAFQDIEPVLLAAIYAARVEIVLTTPYFVPGEPLVTALCSAAARGVAVHLVVPRRNDSRLAQHASASYFEDLMAAGATIHRFPGGLLHTKSMVIDGQLSMMGSVNLDLRSFKLNFELSVLVYDRPFSGRLRTLQQSYMMVSERLHLPSWRRRPAWRRMLENAAQLASPLL